MEVYGEEMFNGLACPPLDDFAFNFVSDHAAMNLDPDIFFEDPTSIPIPIRLKQQPPRKGKELKTLIHVLKPTADQLFQTAARLKQEKQEAKMKINKPNKMAERKGKEEVLLSKDESAIQLKFESTKRKLHDSYQRIEDAKKRKKIQLIEFQNPMQKPKPKAIRGSMKKNCLGGKKCYKFNRSTPQY